MPPPHEMFGPHVCDPHVCGPHMCGGPDPCGPHMCGGPDPCGPHNPCCWCLNCLCLPAREIMHCFWEFSCLRLCCGPLPPHLFGGHPPPPPTFWGHHHHHHHHPGPWW